MYSTYSSPLRLNFVVRTLKSPLDHRKRRKKSNSNLIEVILVVRSLSVTYESLPLRLFSIFNAWTEEPWTQVINKIMSYNCYMVEHYITLTSEIKVLTNDLTSIYQWLQYFHLDTWKRNKYCMANDTNSGIAKCKVNLNFQVQYCFSPNVLWDPKISVSNRSS